MSNFFKFYLILIITLKANGQQEFTAALKAIVSEVFLGEPLEKSFKKVGSKAYYFGQNKVSWFKAAVVCRSLGGHLASVDSQNDLKDLTTYLTTTFGSARLWWLSGSDQEPEGDFFWYSTGQRLEYADWYAPQPDNQNDDENCVYVEYHRPLYQMFDGKCDRKMYYICESNMKTIILNL